MLSRTLSDTRRELMFGLAGTALAFSRVRNSMYDRKLRRISPFGCGKRRFAMRWVPASSKKR
jgi:hypothetical protein